MDRWTPFTDFFIVSFFSPLLSSFVCSFSTRHRYRESADLVHESKKNHPWLLPVANKNSSARSDCFDDCPVHRYSPRGSAQAQPSNLARKSSCAASSVPMTVEFFISRYRLLQEIEIFVCLKKRVVLFQINGRRCPSFEETNFVQQRGVSHSGTAGWLPQSSL